MIITVTFILVELLTLPLPKVISTIIVQVQTFESTFYFPPHMLLTLGLVCMC